MVTPKNLIQNSKTDLGWDTRDADYTSWRNADFYEELTGRWKRSETSKNLAIKRARKRAHAHENSDEEEDISDAGKAVGTAVAFRVYDPEIGEHRDINGWIWDELDRRNLVVIQIKTLDGIWDMVKAHVPADRKVREILGAFKDPNPPNLSFPANYTGFHSDTVVKAFFRMSKSDPVRLMVLLHSVPPRANTPPEPILTSNLRSLSPGTNMKILPRILMRTYAMSLGSVGIGCLQETILSNNASIIDSDDEDYCYIRYLKRPKINSGPQLVKARQVVAVGRQAT
ncbi:hypothetical protein BGX38DRAFT_1275142 [Terfezia claveryi]|nr:hypothetical protein BGX38DRAFT_1275142 [Terfezia claveryi]